MNKILGPTYTHGGHLPGQCSLQQAAAQLRATAPADPAQPVACPAPACKATPACPAYPTPARPGVPACPAYPLFTSPALSDTTYPDKSLTALQFAAQMSLITAAAAVVLTQDKKHQDEVKDLQEELQESIEKARFWKKSEGYFRKKCVSSQDDARRKGDDATG